jgi:hypothetical protein
MAVNVWLVYGIAAELSLKEGKTPSVMVAD